MKNKKLIFLSINKKYLSYFNKYIKNDNSEYCFVLRSGITKNDISNFLKETDGYNFIDYEKDEYLKEELCNKIKLKSFEAIILCRDINVNVDLEYFYEILNYVYKTKNNVYLLDLNGNKKRILPADIRRLRVKHLDEKEMQYIIYLLYKVYAYVIIIPISIILVLISPLIRLISFIKLKVLKKKWNICIAKRVHSNQSYIIKKGLIELGHKTFTVDLVGHVFNYKPCDINKNLSNCNPFYKYLIISAVFIYSIIKYDVIMFQNNGESYFVSPLFKNWEISRLHQIIEMMLYKILGKKVIFEMRDCTAYDRKLALNDDSRTICKHCNEDRISKLCDNQKYVKSNKIALKYADKILYSTLDLKDHLLENAEWLPNGYIPDSVHSNSINNEKIRVIHSSTCEYMKGTNYVLPVMDKLKKKYPIEFELFKGCPHSEVLNKIKSADIAIGQMNHGITENFDIECFMNAVPVVGYINPKLEGLFPEVPPMVKVDPNDIEGSLYDKVEMLVLNKSLRIEIGNKSKEYAMKVHDYRKVANRLSKIIQKLY
ncbi:MAG: hypothetical protein KAI43_09415 [Candidatus Aureabacteria bacterium]|nr:hypothetical protein [Candidatus Auribacterota bacterium]